MPAKYNLVADQYGNFSLAAQTETHMPNGQIMHRPGWAIDNAEDLAALKVVMADCDRALRLLNGINPATLETTAEPAA